MFVEPGHILPRGHVLPLEAWGSPGLGEQLGP
jgi:hypothetical protein